MSEYAVYKGDDLLVIGTRQECADKLGIKPKTVSFYTTPTHRKRIGNSDKSLIAIKIEEDEE